MVFRQTVHSAKLLIIASFLLVIPTSVSAFWSTIPGGCPPVPGCNDPEPARQPVLLVPGLAASHNSKLIFKDQAGGTWDFTPSVNKQWQPLIDRLVQEGYELNKNLFIVFYDWRKSNTQSAVGYLIPAINRAKAISGEDKVDIIAHSMGGLVARAYAQSENLYNDDIDQIIFLGTPNEGAAGTYVAWEGGDFPVNWRYEHKYWINRVERNLEHTHDTGDIKRPLAFRTFFPSLEELLPINPFITRDSDELPVGDLVAQNDFLVNLKNTAYRLDDRGISVTTVAGTNSQTLSNIVISADRTPKDIRLSRWRDGRPYLEPILPDSSDGDQTVLSSSVHSIGSDFVTLPNLIHEALPAGAQSIAMNRLIPNPVAAFVPYTLASALLGVDILSPIAPQITGPNGEVLSSTENTFDDAYFDWDLDNPNDIKMLTIIDPPEGDYVVKLTGTDKGDYTVITSYADEDDDIFIEREGSTKLGRQETYTFTIGDGTFIPNMSLLELTLELKETIKELYRGSKHEHKNKHEKHEGEDEHEDEDEHQDKHIKHHGKLLGAANKLHNTAKKYIKSLDKHGEDNKKTKKEKSKLLKSFEKFSDKLDKEISKDHLDEEAVEEIVRLRDGIALVLGL